MQGTFFPYLARVTPILALDCEMVETEAGDAVGRVSIVNYNGKTVYDKFVRPEKKIVDYRSHVSGITPEALKKGISFAQCKSEVNYRKDRVGGENTEGENSRGTHAEGGPERN